MRHLLVRSLVVLVAVAATMLATQSNAAQRPARELTLVVPSSLSQSGLLERLLPEFEKRAKVEIKVIEREAAEAVRLAAQGGADILWLDDEKREAAAIKSGIVVARHDVMYGELVLIGPTKDPAGIKGMTSVIDAVRLIASAEAPFVSRGDDSALNRIEQGIWDEAGITVANTEAKDWYSTVGTGTRDSLETAIKRNAYAIIDRASWLITGNRKNHDVLVGDDPRMLIQYGVMLVNPAKHKHVRGAIGNTFIRWLTSKAVQKQINDFAVAGAYPFTANHGLKQKR